MKKVLLSRVIEVQSDVPEVRAILETFFRAFPSASGATSLSYTIKASNGKLCVLEGDGKAPLFSGDSPLEIVYLLEGFLYNHILPSIRDHLTFHGAAVEKGGKALLLLGPAGSGKSLLTLALLQGVEGCSYLSDDACPLSPEGGQYRVSPFPRAIRLREWAPSPFSLPPNQCFSLPPYSVRFFLPTQRFATTEPPVSLLLFPEWNPSRLEFLRLKSGEAAMYLTALAFNEPECLLNGGLGLIAQLAQKVPAYRLLWHESLQAALAIERLFSGVS